MMDTFTFSLGSIFITPAAGAEIPPDDVQRALASHSLGDWGEVGPEDWSANDRALMTGTRVVSAYYAGTGRKFWIITEADRSATTVLLPEDY